MSEDVRSAATRLIEEIRASSGSDPGFETNRLLKKQWANRLEALVADFSHQITRQQDETKGDQARMDRLSTDPNASRTAPTDLPDAINRKANDFVREFNKLAENDGFDLPMQLLEPLIGMFEEALGVPVSNEVIDTETSIRYHVIGRRLIDGDEWVDLALAMHVQEQRARSVRLDLFNRIFVDAAPAVAALREEP